VPPDSISGLLDHVGLVWITLRLLTHLGVLLRDLACGRLFALHACGDVFAHTVELAPRPFLGPEPIIWRHRRDTRDAEHASREQSRHRQRVRAPARAADHREALHLERVRDRRHITSGVRDFSPAVTIRASVARPVVGDQSNAKPSQEILEPLLDPPRIEQPTARRPVHREDRNTVQRTPFRDAELPAVGRCHNLSMSIHRERRAGDPTLHVGLPAIYRSIKPLGPEPPDPR
jgi:hypothetical protein